ncbi:hypothetical protein F2P56_013039 [Juglans regia]|uniref:Uncharacterized protein n=2 Tax=Juglans regia TaxID=51240 RepID=A0A833XPY9_JUGRE|nr:uncharacterized protein LOC108997515 [Juglans regia]KAF5468931.1 hypothetical protein F2P56_013039 [Juglans regia]
MSCLSWNCQGLGNPWTVRELHLLVKNNVPNFVFLMETKCRRNKVERIKKLLNMENSFIADCKGLSGGLAFLWKAEMDAVLESYTQHHISLKVKNSLDGKTWILTGFYGDPITAKRQGSWQLLRRLKPANDLGWLCVRDFNEIVTTNEKSGGMLRPYRQMVSFRKALEECELSDMGFVGNKYTWSNNRYGDELTKERLDRGLCNAIWASWNPRAVVLSLTALTSDHCPILISKDNSQKDISNHTKPFRYEVSWAQREACNKLIAEEWSRPRLASNKLNSVTEGLKRCQVKLQQWSKQAMSGTKKEDLFNTSCPQNIDGCLAATRPKVTEEMNQDLKRPYTAQEIEEALFQMDGLSSPGPDGYPAAFFQQH